MSRELASILRWPILALIAVVIFLELQGSIPRWGMGLLLVPLFFVFFYLWQRASS